GQVIEYRNGSEWVRFQPMALQYSNDLNQIQQISMPQAVDASVDDDMLTWTDGYGPGRSLSWQAQTARLAKLLTIGSLADLPAVDQFILDGGTPVLELNLIFAHSAGVTPYVNGQPWSKGDRNTQGLVEFRDGQGNILWWFNLPRSWDTEDNEQLGTFRFKKQGNSLYVSHRVSLSFVQGAVYPLFVDVTVDEQVGADADDAYHVDETHFFSTGGFSVNFGSLSAASDGAGAVQRFTTVAIGNADTIDVAYLTWNPNVTRSNTVCKAKLDADDADSPSAPANDTDYHNIVRTAAVVTWDPIPTFTLDTPINSPSIVSVIQELVDRGGWASGNAMVILCHDDDLLSSADALRGGDSYDSDSTLAPKLHIEYTAAAGGVTVLAALATATALSFVAAVSTGLVVLAVLATATALSPVSTHINTVSAPVATATALSPVSVVSGAAAIVGALATASALSWDATTSLGALVVGALGTATAQSYA
ncbi:hypothetical protein LCGC14_2564180, partial [marine sediment metagenome]